MQTDSINLSDAELAAAYESECAVAARMYDAGADCTTIDARVDALLDELIRRGLA